MKWRVALWEKQQNWQMLGNSPEGERRSKLIKLGIKTETQKQKSRKFGK